MATNSLTKLAVRVASSSLKVIRGGGSNGATKSDKRLGLGFRSRTWRKQFEPMYYSPPCPKSKSASFAQDKGSCLPCCSDREPDGSPMLSLAMDRPLGVSSKPSFSSVVMAKARAALLGLKVAVDATFWVLSALLRLVGGASGSALEGPTSVGSS